MHYQENEQGKEWKHVVVPKQRRMEILKLSHSSMTGGHFSLRKTQGVLRRVFTWPGVSRAFDLVGPLPRTKQGHRYLLTCICLGSKYPDAVPLKRVDAQNVAEGMCEIFSRTGIPNELLTDQGSVFTGKLHMALCNLLGIHHLKTSAYHPQTDGCLERWHASIHVAKATKPSTRLG